MYSEIGVLFFSNERVQYADSAPIPKQILYVIRRYIVGVKWYFEAKRIVKKIIFDLRKIVPFRPKGKTSPLPVIFLSMSSCVHASMNQL